MDADGAGSPSDRRGAGPAGAQAEAQAEASQVSSASTPHGPRDDRAHPVAWCRRIMSLLSLKSTASLLFLLTLAASCAEGKGDPEATDNSLAGAAGQAGAAGAAGQAAGNGGAGGGAAGGGAAGAGQGGAAGQGNAGSGGALTPCDPLEPSACDHKCTVVGKQFACDPAGSAGDGEACGADQVGDSCGPNLLCVQGKCARFCATNTDCVGERTCSLVLDGPTPGATFKVCEPKGNECDPAKQTGCGAGQACYPQTSGYKCDSPGAAAVGAACTFASDCAAGASCFKLGGETRCYKLCDLAAPDCGAGQKCSKQDDVYGICTGG